MVGLWEVKPCDVYVRFSVAFVHARYLHPTRTCYNISYTSNIIYNIIGLKGRKKICYQTTDVDKVNSLYADSVLPQSLCVLD